MLLAGKVSRGKERVRRSCTFSRKRGHESSLTSFGGSQKRKSTFRCRLDGRLGTGQAGCAMNEMLGLLNEEIMSLCNSDTAAESDLKKKKEKLRAGYTSLHARERGEGLQRRVVDLLNCRRSDELEELTAGT